MTLAECLEHMLRDPAVTPYLVTSRIPTDIPFTEVSDPACLCQTPLVSVLMRAYNAEATIGRAIESIVTQQTDFPFELIIADDASTDGTPAVCREWLAKHPDKIRILRAKQNIGMFVADALLHTQARGDWIAECDSDDFWLTPHKLQRQLDLVRRHNAVLCVSNFFFEDVRDGRRWSIPMPNGDLIPPTDIQRYYFQTSTLLYSKAAYERLVREIPLPMEGDAFKPQLLASLGPIAYLNEPSSVYFVGQGAWSHLSEGMKAWLVSRAYIGLHLYGHPALRRTYALLALKQIRLALHPKKGLTQAEYDARRDLLRAIIRHLVRRLHFHPKALLLAFKIRARAKHLVTPDRTPSHRRTAMKNYPPPRKCDPETVVWNRTLSEKALRYFAKFLLLFVPKKSVFGRMLHARILWKARVTDYHRFVVKEVTGLVKTFDGTCDVLALGSSHIRCGIRPESAKSLAIWNGGVGFCDYHGLYWIYRWYRKRWPYREGQAVVVGEDFWQAATRMECSFDFFRAVSNHIFFDVPYYYPAIFSRPYEPYVRFIASLPDSVKSGQQDDRFSKVDPNKPKVEIPHNAMIDVTGSSARFHWETISRYKPVEVKWLKRLLDAIERDGRKAIVVRTPLHEGYRTKIREFAARDGVPDVYAHEVKVRGNRPLLNYADLPLPDIAFDPDGHHLNRQGAALFTPHLEADLLRILGKSGA